MSVLFCLSGSVIYLRSQRTNWSTQFDLIDHDLMQPLDCRVAQLHNQTKHRQTDRVTDSHKYDDWQKDKKTDRQTEHDHTGTQTGRVTDVYRLLQNPVSSNLFFTFSLLRPLLTVWMTAQLLIYAIRQRQGPSERHAHTEVEIQVERHGDTETEAETQRQRHREKQKQRHGYTEEHKQRQTQKHRGRDTDRQMQRYGGRDT